MTSFKSIIFYVLLIFFLIVPLTSASGITVSAVIDKAEATLDDQLNLSVTVNGAQKISEPVFPPVKDFQIIPNGNSSEVKIINGVFSASKAFNYILIPQREGNFTIEQIRVEVQGKVYKTNPINIKISSSVANEPKVISESKDFFLTAEVSNPNPYINEQINYIIRFYRKVPVSDASLERPNFEGFLMEEYGKEKETVKVIDGNEYLVYETKVALFPTRPGKLEIPPAKLRFEAVKKSKNRGFFADPFSDDPFFSRGQIESKILSTKTLEVQVKPLPKENRPANFANLVGNFKFTATLNKDKIKIGESATLTLEVSGHGNIRGVPEPSLKESPDFKVYSDQPATVINNEGNILTGKKIFKKAIIPLKEGTFHIPSVEISFFNPETGKYEKAISQKVTFTGLITGEDDKLHFVENFKGLNPKESIKVLRKDILPINMSISVLKDQRLNLYDPLYLAFSMIPALSYLSCLIYKKRKDRYLGDIKFARSKKAFKEAKKKIKEAKIEHEMGKEDFCADLSRAVREYLGNKFNITGSALTPGEVLEKLEAAGIDKNSVEETKKFLEKLEYEKFVSKTLSVKKIEELLNSGKELLKRLEKDFRRTTL